jgi:hypothetical protein
VETSRVETSREALAASLRADEWIIFFVLGARALGALQGGDQRTNCYFLGSPGKSLSAYKAAALSGYCLLSSSSRAAAASVSGPGGAGYL